MLASAENSSKMSPYSFSPQQRYAVYTVHAETSYLCNAVIECISLRNESPDGLRRGRLEEVGGAPAAGPDLFTCARQSSSIHGRITELIRTSRARSTRSQMT